MQTQIFPRITPSVGLPILYLENDERFKFTQHDVSLNMANKNTLVDPIIVANLNQSPQFTKSPQMQNGNIQKINDDNRPSPEHKIYHFHNCRIMNSFNTRTITMENSGNKVPQVTICSSFFLFSHLCPHVMSYYQFTRIVAMKRVMKIYLCNLMPSLLMVRGYFPLASPTKHVEHL